MSESKIIKHIAIPANKIQLPEAQKDILSAIGFVSKIPDTVPVIGQVIDGEAADLAGFKQLVLKYSTADSDVLNYTIFNAEGKSMLSSNVNLQKGMDHELSISLEDHLMPGIYFLKLAQGNYSETLKFIRIK